MQMHEAGEVLEVKGDEMANRMLSDGWTLLAVVSGNNPRDLQASMVTYVLGRKPMMNPMIPERHALQGALQNATEDEFLALAELGEWMAKHQWVLVTGRANGIRIGTTREVQQFMLDSLAPEVAGAVAGNLVLLPN